MHALERRVVGGHAAVVEPRDGLHSRLGHILLRQDDSQFLGAVVAVVEEYNRVALLDRPVKAGVDDGLDKLVRHPFVVGLLHCLHHVCGFLALAADELVIGQLDALPTLVAVHGVVAADNRRHTPCRSLAMLLQLRYETLAAPGVGVAAVHEAVDERAVAQAVVGCQVAQLEEVHERTVHAPVRSQAHEVYALAFVTGVGKGGGHLGVLGYRAVGARAVDLHEVLVDYAPGTDVEMPHLGVAHLPVGQADILAAGLEARVRIGLQQIVPVRGRGAEDGVVLAVVAKAPPVENHQKSFFSHNRSCLLICPV